jgi:hypothetical protein
MSNSNSIINNTPNLNSLRNSPNLNMNNSNDPQNLQSKQQPTSSPLRNSITNNTTSQ